MLGLRLEDLARKTGYDISYLSRLEKGERRLTLSVAARLLEAFQSRGRGGAA
jgi:transcriptional regulator with XRE-family HTH domain